MAERDHRTIHLIPRIPNLPIPPFPRPPGGGGGGEVEPDPEDGSGTDTPSARRRYVVVAERFRCGDESGVDWFGSDEVRWSFTTKCGDDKSVTNLSREFGNVDSGNERSFGPGQGEIVPPEGNTADGLPAPFAVSIQLIEIDQGKDLEKEVKQVFDLLQKVPKYGEWVKQVPDFVRNHLVDMLEDDLMGSNTIAFRERDLERRLPTVGSSFVDRLYFGGQGGDLPFAVAGGPDYYLYLRATRIADARQ